MAPTSSESKRRVAVLGGNRIPFARSDRAYAEASNQDMFTAALGGLIDRFGLAGEQLGVVVGGAVLKHSRDFNLMRECVLGSQLSPYTPAFDLQQACGTGLQAAIAAADGIAAEDGPLEAASEDEPPRVADRESVDDGDARVSPKDGAEAAGHDVEVHGIRNQIDVASRLTDRDIEERAALADVVEGPT